MLFYLLRNLGKEVIMKVAINGFGRIGRTVLRVCLERGIEVVAINDPHGIKDAEYLLKFDSIYGKYPKKVSVKGDCLIVGGNQIKIIQQRDIRKLNWEKFNVDIVIESTGVFTKPKDARVHLKKGVKYVLVTAPCKQGKPDLTLVPGVNDNKLNKKCKLISIASCTTNCLVPVVKVLNDGFKIQRALMTTIHAYTNDQTIQDAFHKKLRRGRAAAQNIIPTTTGASQSVVEVLPELLGKINGLAVRVPVEDGSLVDLVAEIKKKATVSQINKEFEKASKGKMKGILEYSKDELVSSDVIGNSHSAVIDSLSTQVNGNLVKVLAWYDNEYGYSCRVVDVIEKIKGL